MRNKKKWQDIADDNLLNHIDKVSKIVNPLFENNGKVNLTSLDKRSDLEHLMALILNCKFTSSEDKNGRSFGVDIVTALQLEVENNQILKYWGKINWLSKPNDHECHQSYQDPFYGLLKLENNQLELVQAMFGDYDSNDLDGKYWISSEMNWMYYL